MVVLWPLPLQLDPMHIAMVLQLLVEWMTMEMAWPVVPEPDVAASNVVTNTLLIDRLQPARCRLQIL